MKCAYPASWAEIDSGTYWIRSRTASTSITESIKRNLNKESSYHESMRSPSTVDASQVCLSCNALLLFVQCPQGTQQCLVDFVAHSSEDERLSSVLISKSGCLHSFGCNHVTLHFNRRSSSFAMFERLNLNSSLTGHI